MYSERLRKYLGGHVRNIDRVRCDRSGECFTDRVPYILLEIGIVRFHHGATASAINEPQATGCRELRNSEQGPLPWPHFRKSGFWVRRGVPICNSNWIRSPILHESRRWCHPLRRVRPDRIVSPCAVHVRNAHDVVVPELRSPELVSGLNLQHIPFCGRRNLSDEVLRVLVQPETTSSGNPVAFRRGKLQTSS